MGVWQNILGTTSNFFKIGLTGVKLENSGGDLVIKNNSDTTSAVTTSKLNMTGNTLDINSDASDINADRKYTIQRPTTGMTSAVTLTLPTNVGATNQLLKTDGSGNLSWSDPQTTTPTCTLDSTTLTYDSISTVTMFRLPANAIITQIDVMLDTTFNGTSPEMSVGVSGTPSKYLGIIDANLKGSAKDIYTVFPCEMPNASLENLIITYNDPTTNSTTGSARVIVYYNIPV